MVMIAVATSRSGFSFQGLIEVVSIAGRVIIVAENAVIVGRKGIRYCGLEIDGMLR